jgi:hypothetical protein
MRAPTALGSRTKSRLCALGRRVGNPALSLVRRPKPSEGIGYREAGRHPPRVSGSLSLAPECDGAINNSTAAQPGKGRVGAVASGM